MNATKRLALLPRLLGAALAAWAVGGAPAAKAQDIEPAAYHMWSAKIGAFMPTQGTFRNQSGSPLLAIGADYDPNFRFKLATGRISFGGEFRYRENGGARFLSIPLTAKVLWTVTPLESRFHGYAGFGAGLTILNTAFLGSTTQPHAKFIAGVDVTDRYFFEVNYDYVGGFSDNLGNGLRGDGLSLYIGRRF